MPKSDPSIKAEEKAEEKHATDPLESPHKKDTVIAPRFNLRFNSKLNPVVFYVKTRTESNRELRYYKISRGNIERRRP